MPSIMGFGFGSTDIEFIFYWRDRPLKPMPHGKLCQRGQAA